MKIKNKLLWLLSLLIPIVGIILYFVLKKNNKKLASSSLSGAIVGFCVYGIFVLYLSTHSGDYTDRPVSRWQNDVSSGRTVVTVLAASYCQHCQAYKPIITALANKKNLDLYFYEVDMIPEGDLNTLTNTYQLKDYTGNVPYTFIIKNGQFVNSYIGYENEEAIRNFLSENGVIKN